MNEKYDIVIIGAGPAGVLCAAHLIKNGFDVLIIEKNFFPRFSIGESMLSYNVKLIEEAGLGNVFRNVSFHKKNGAQFLIENNLIDINFIDKSCSGPSDTYQVTRSIFDLEMANEVQKLGAEIIFGSEIIDVKFSKNEFAVDVETKNKNQKIENFQAKFLVDASGFGKVLPKLLSLPTEERNQKRMTIFSHIKCEKLCQFDNQKILISVDEIKNRNWFWTIPLGGNIYSLGLTTEDNITKVDYDNILKAYINRNSLLKSILGDFEFLFSPKCIKGFSSKTLKVHDDNFIIIGNSGEFVDPIFSSGLTVALKSGCLAANVITKYLNGENVDWNLEYTSELNYGLNTFKAFIDSWYNGELIEIFQSHDINFKIKQMIISILAGYAWDHENYFTRKTGRKLSTISEICRAKSMFEVNDISDSNLNKNMSI